MGPLTTRRADPSEGKRPAAPGEAAGGSGAAGDESPRPGVAGVEPLTPARAAGQRSRAATVQTVREFKGSGRRLVMVTAYDAPTARAVDRAAVDLILVGDSLGMVVLGYDDTLQVDMVDMLRHTAAVRRGAPGALVVADMPFLSYQVSPERAVLNAGRLVRSGADAVKLEGGRSMVPTIEAILRASIPVMGHLGLTPQSIKSLGGYRVQGRRPETAQAIVDEALAIEATGVFAMVLEGIPSDLGRRVTEAVGVPTIGIGAGPATDGQVLVLHDLSGLSEGRLPRFVKRYGRVGEAIEEAVTTFAAEVRSGAYPEPGHCYD